jgi:S1-C subfamily serine protease
MGISSAYKIVKNSIVAFILKYVPLFDEKELPPPFPPILGTGFVMREDGIILTNAHVVRAFSKAPRPPDAPADEWPVIALLFKRIEQGMIRIPLEILGVGGIKKFDTGVAYYGPKEGPDIAFVHVKARGLPAVTIDSKTLVEEGVEIATAGFPMGTDALTAPGWLHQLTPTLQRGVVSAVLPFACETPHAYSVNIMAHGGASGSPVFLTDSGAVVGVLYGGLHDIDFTLKQKDPFRVPTNISYVVPAHYIVRLLEEIDSLANMKLPPDTMTINDMLANSELVDALKEGRQWQIRKVDPQAEAARVSNVVTRVDPKRD